LKSGRRKNVISVFLLASALCVTVAATGAMPPAAATQNGQVEIVSAADLLQQARRNREVFTKDFQGFRSKLTVRLDGKSHHGTCLFRVPATLEVELNGGKPPSVVEAAVRNMLLHRVPSSTAVTAEARYGEPDAHSLGKKVLLNDKYQSTYRIKNRQILEVDRKLSEFRRVLTVLETRKTASGRYLPRHVLRGRVRQRFRLGPRGLDLHHSLPGGRRQLSPTFPARAPDRRGAKQHPAD
jgi:hypothetical protein